MFQENTSAHWVGRRKTLTMQLYSRKVYVHVHLSVVLDWEFCLGSVPRSCHHPRSGLTPCPWLPPQQAHTWIAGQTLAPWAARRERCLRPAWQTKMLYHIYPWCFLDRNFRLFSDFINNEEGKRSSFAVKLDDADEFYFCTLGFLFSSVIQESY